jgi:hypothetical protein
MPGSNPFRQRRLSAASRNSNRTMLLWALKKNSTFLYEPLEALITSTVFPLPSGSQFPLFKVDRLSGFKHNVPNPSCPPAEWNRCASGEYCWSGINFFEALVGQNGVRLRMSLASSYSSACDSNYPEMTAQELRSKLDRVYIFQKVSSAQLDRALKLWGGFSSIKDFAEVMKSMASFGQPKPL